MLVLSCHVSDQEGDGSRLDGEGCNARLPGVISLPSRYGVYVRLVARVETANWFLIAS